jgi:hypothetical protein
VTDAPGQLGLFEGEKRERLSKLDDLRDRIRDRFGG